MEKCLKIFDFYHRVNFHQILLLLKNTAAIIIPCQKKTDLDDPGGSINTITIEITGGQGHTQGHHLDQDQGRGHQQETIMKVSL